MTDNSVLLPDGVSVETFKPVAYYDQHMDFIRVMTRDVSVTEHRIDGFFTVHECNHRGSTDPRYVGFTIKGVRHLFNEIGLPLDGVYKLTEVIDRLVRYKPGSVMSETLKIIFEASEPTEDLEIDFKEAA